MLTIGVVVSALENRGPVNVIRSQFSHMAANEHFIVFCLTNRIDKNIVEEFTSYGVAVVVLDGSSFVSKVKSLRLYIKKMGVNILHSHGTPADLCSALTFNKVKKITTVHNCLLNDFLPLFGFFKGTFIFLLQMLSFLFIENKIACSKTVGRVLDRWYVNNFVIQNGVNQNIYKPASVMEQIKLKEKYKIDCSGVLFIYCGSFINRKNIVFLLKSIKLNKNDKFILVGEGPLLNECKNITKNDPRFIFLGQLESCVDLYKIADYFISASLSEGLPLAVLEAYSCGAKLIISNIPSHREIYDLAAKGSVALFLNNSPDDLNLCMPSHSDEVVFDYAPFSSQAMSKKYSKFYLQVK